MKVPFSFSFFSQFPHSFRRRLHSRGRNGVQQGGYFFGSFFFCGEIFVVHFALFSSFIIAQGLSMLQLRRHHRRGNGASEKKNNFLFFKDLFAGKEVFFSILQMAPLANLGFDCVNIPGAVNTAGERKRFKFYFRSHLHSFPSPKRARKIGCVFVELFCLQEIFF